MKEAGNRLLLENPKSCSWAFSFLMAQFICRLQGCCLSRFPANSFYKTCRVSSLDDEGVFQRVWQMDVFKTLGVFFKNCRSLQFHFQKLSDAPHIFDRSKGRVTIGASNQSTTALHSTESHRRAQSVSYHENENR